MSQLERKYRQELKAFQGRIATAQSRGFVVPQSILNVAYSSDPKGGFAKAYDKLHKYDLAYIQRHSTFTHPIEGEIHGGRAMNLARAQQSAMKKFQVGGKVLSQQDILTRWSESAKFVSQVYTEQEQKEDEKKWKEEAKRKNRELQREKRKAEKEAQKLKEEIEQKQRELDRIVEDYNLDEFKEEPPKQQIVTPVFRDAVIYKAEPEKIIEALEGEQSETKDLQELLQSAYESAYKAVTQTEQAEERTLTLAEKMDDNIYKVQDMIMRVQNPDLQDKLKKILDQAILDDYGGVAVAITQNIDNESGTWKEGSVLEEIEKETEYQYKEEEGEDEDEEEAKEQRRQGKLLRKFRGFVTPKPATPVKPKKASAPKAKPKPTPKPEPKPEPKQEPKKEVNKNNQNLFAQIGLRRLKKK